MIKMALGVEVGLGPGHIVQDGDPAPSPKKRGRGPPQFRHISGVAKWLDASKCTWYGGRPQPTQLCVRWGPAPLPKKGVFSQCLLWPNSWMDQDATRCGRRARPNGYCVTWGPSSPLPKKGTAPNFPPMSIVGKQLYVSGYHLVWT